SKAFVKQVDVCAATDVFIGKEDKPFLIEKLEKSLSNFKEEALLRAKDIAGELKDSLNEGSLSELYFLMPLLKTSPITHFLQENTVIVYDECKLLQDSALIIAAEFFDRYKGLSEAGEAF